MKSFNSWRERSPREDWEAKWQLVLLRITSRKCRDLAKNTTLLTDVTHWPIIRTLFPKEEEGGKETSVSFTLEPKSLPNQTTYLIFMLTPWVGTPISQIRDQLVSGRGRIRIQVCLTQNRNSLPSSLGFSPDSDLLCDTRQVTCFLWVSGPHLLNEGNIPQLIARAPLALTFLWFYLPGFWTSQINAVSNITHTKH